MAIDLEELPKSIPGSGTSLGTPARVLEADARGSRVSLALWINVRVRDKTALDPSK